jgi:menaquinone-dependent protoporphyrinogen IX oxidase
MSYLTENWVNCAVLTGNSAGLRTVLSSRLSHRELSSSLRESHSPLSLPADTTMASSQGTSVSSNSLSRRASHDIFLSKYHFLLHTLRFLFFFSDNVMADVASKQQTTALFLSTTVTRTRRHPELIKKTDKPDGKPVLCQRTFTSVFRVVFLHS